MRSSITVALISLALCAACGSSDSDDTPPAATPPSLTIGGPPMTLQVAQVPEASAETGAQQLPLNIAQAGNYQCTAHAQQGAESLDAQMAFLQGPTELTRDSDSGEGVDAMVVRQLNPGTYTVKVWEWRGRAASINVSCAIAPPALPTQPLSIGAPGNVTVPAGEGPHAQGTFTLNVAAPGSYRCLASAPGLDAQMQLLQNDVEIASDSDSGGNFDAQIVRDLTPGTYTIRVWEWQHRPAPITVRCDPHVAVPVAPATPLALGTPANVVVAGIDGPGGQTELDLAITSPGSYRCHAHAAQGPTNLDAQMVILQNGAELAADSDSGGNNDAQITRELAPGAYRVRVWEWLHRPATITVTCGLAPPA